MGDSTAMRSLVLLNEIQSIRDASISKKSRDMYLNSNVRLIKYLSQFHDLVVISVEESHIRKCLINKDMKPLNFENLTILHLMSFFTELRKKSGDKPSMSTYSQFRSALFNLFRDFKVEMPTKLVSELEIHFKGLKNKNAKERTGKVKIGKDAITFSLYRKICLEMLKSSEVEMVFGRVFLILTWNLMCRCANTINLHYDHMEWCNDSLDVYFSQMKNDQSGERTDARAVFANPVIPEICPIAAIGIYFLTQVSQLNYIL